MNKPALYIGLMSGTSLDGVDGVLVDLSGSPVAGERSGNSMKVLAHAYAPFPKDLRDEFLALNAAGVNEIHRAALAGNALAQAYAQVVNMLLAESGCQAGQIQAIGAHGQTVRHRPQEFDGTGYTSQINNPALLAELTGIDVAADFRSRDVAAGGQGAPLVPAFHRAMFGRADQAVAVLNIGGISNVTLLPPQSALNSQDILGFDCGPGNALMDYWCQKHTGQAFDSGGQWAASGQVIPDLLAMLLNEPYFTKTPPKSTGRDLFNPAWLESRLTGFSGFKPVDVMATLTELTSNACAESVASYGINSKSLLVCGGGALNNHLMARLKARLPGVRVESTEFHGLPPLQVEAAAFAWLARKCVQRETGNLQKVTGARGARILGGIYAA